MKLGIIGAGSWGTALFSMYSQKYNMVWWMRKEEKEIIMTHKENLLYMAGFKLNLANAVLKEFGEEEQVDLALVVVPMKWLEVVLNQHKFLKNIPVIIATKGINTNLQLPFQVAKKMGFEKIFGLSGPNLAKEIIRKLPATTVVAGEDTELLVKIQENLTTDYFRVYRSDDVLGIQLAGALKNVIAIAAGMCDALKLGMNAKSALLTRGLAEIRRLGVAMGAKQETFFGLAGIGDLLTTANSSLSRNYSVGYKLGEGKKLDEILSSMRMVAEGVETVKNAVKLASKLEVEMPITFAVYKIIMGELSINEAIKELFNRDLKDESY